MTFKPAIWYPIAVGLCIFNLVSVWLVVEPAQPWHATGHAVLALAFGLWAQRLRRGTGGRTPQPPAGSELQAGLEALDAEMNKLRQELSETQERLDFAERMLAQGRETRRMGPSA